MSDDDEAFDVPSLESADRRTTLRVVMAELTIILLVVVGIGALARGASAPIPSSASGSVTAVTVSLADLPAATAEIYQYAADHADHFADIPCYCGCDRSLGHRNLEDCFVNPAGGWDAHASGCGICTAEALTAQELLDANTHIAVVRQAIIDRYGPPSLT